MNSAHDIPPVPPLPTEETPFLDGWTFPLTPAELRLAEECAELEAVFGAVPGDGHVRANAEALSRALTGRGIRHIVHHDEHGVTLRLGPEHVNWVAHAISMAR
ncbi:hypothetical protein ABZV65_30625 [Streptomyces bauhiniae]|uniref:hypothetical protein n=1 Tax=Streptomyces bauhiniae TaxID=2340725 RepID=UPI0033AEAA2C